MKFLSALVAALALCAPVRAADATDPAAFAFTYVCEVTQLDCSNLTPPEVRYADLTGLKGWYGYYWYARDPNTVWLDVQFQGEPFNVFAMSVLIHETTHYVHRHVDPWATSCAAEELAFAVGNLWLIEHGRWQDAWWDWFIAYNCEV